MSDYESQFQADLERAQALSLESLALEQIRRRRTSCDSTARNEPSFGTNEIPCPIPPPPKPTRRPRPSPRTSGMRSTSNSPTPNDVTNVDLISFTSPSSVEKNHIELKERIKELQKLNEQIQNLANTSHDPTRSHNLNKGSYFMPNAIVPHQSNFVDNSVVTSQFNRNTYVYHKQNSITSSNNLNIGGDVETNNILYNILNNQTSTPSNSNPQLDFSHNYQSNYFNNITYRSHLTTSQSADREFQNPNSTIVAVNQSSISKSKSVEVNMSEKQVQNPPRQSFILDKFGENSSANNWPSSSQQDASQDLIDLASITELANHNVSVLEAFDPLIADQNISDYGFKSECSSSIYEEYDPLDFIYSDLKPKEPIYSLPQITETAEVPPLPSPLPKAFPNQYPKIKRSLTLNKKLFEIIVPIKHRHYDTELIAFLAMIKDVRSRYLYTNAATNPGYVIASKSDGKYPDGTSIKLLVHYEDYQPVTFTCDVQTTVEHIILHVVCGSKGEITEDISGYILRVWGMSEYLTSGSCLKEYTYVRQCVRLERDVVLCLETAANARLARTERDDAIDSHISLEQILPNQGSAPPISHHDLSILLEMLERELSRVVTSVTEGGNVRIGATSQAVKAICALLGGVETVQISTALSTLIHACNQQSKSEQNILKAEIVSDVGDYSNVSMRQATLKDTVGLHCQRLRDAVRAFISIYCRANNVDFEIEDSHYAVPDKNASVSSLSVDENVLFGIEGIHRPPVHWNHDEYIIHAHIYYGTRILKTPQYTSYRQINTAGFYPKILFETWLTLLGTPISKLPKESRLVLTLYGRTLPKDDNPNPQADNKTNKAIEPLDERYSTYSINSSLLPMEHEELGWSAIQLFDFEGKLVSGNFILPLWPVSADKRLGPAPSISDCPYQPHPLIHIEIPSYSQGGVHYDDNTQNRNSKIVNNQNVNRRSFDSLDKHTQQTLMHLIEKGPHQKMEATFREILWEKRHYLVEIPNALPLVLLASVSWDAYNRYQLLQLMDQWKSPSPYDALHLLLPCFPDEGVRAKAAEWLSNSSTPVLTTLIPQLCLALRYESHISTPLVSLLLSRALESPRFAHRLYWQLIHDIPGNSLQNPSEETLGIVLDDNNSPMEVDENFAATSRWIRRNQIILRALFGIIGKNLAEQLLRQQFLVKGLTEVANSIKKCKDNIRNRTLENSINNHLVHTVASGNVCLPLSISQELYNIDVKTCSYFPSNTLPLKINFISSDNTNIPAIFKVGDDLRQDSLVLQVIKVMDELWLKEGLDLSIVTFEAVPTQYRKGIIEMVCNAETLRSIQVEWGLTGSFKDKPIAEWLAKHNPSELEYERAVANFTASCAGYSVVTYLLGICDRHNDNIMLKTSGHLFHIDFGKFLGDAQMFGNFKRDRTPFVLTPDMAYVINGSEHPSPKFHHFVDLCCTAFNIIRKHHNLILNIFSLMASSGISGVSASSVGHVRYALLLDQSPAEAAVSFARLIHSALKSKFTPINFFLHNLAQLRAGDQTTTSNELLSFMPKTYTMEQDGRLIDVKLIDFEKRYDPEKYYVYSLRTLRQDQAVPFIIYRSYKQFTELYQKICLQHPLAKIHRLPVGLHMGRSNTRQVAERRFADLQIFVDSLFQLADEISHSNLVYTFFHPMLRDQQDISNQRIKPKSDVQHVAPSGVGAINISLQYYAGVLSVLIRHARSLPLTSQGQPPSTYVKVYLVPDPSKETKRKTRVLKRNCYPSFMEMLEYRLPLEVIRGRGLQVTVWHHDTLQENQLFGGITLPLGSLDLTKETVEWYPLGDIPRSQTSLRTNANY